ncbi:MAG: phosphoribosylanthranilate isomerase [Prochloraceae cyanobacterium]|nr:phosphoribosylanthranilate isomerase [Prochloraceae cyanobacterium]
MRVKICGITQVEQGRAIASLGATALGFICTSKSPRYVTATQIKEIVKTIPATVDKIGVFVNASKSEIIEVVGVAGLSGVQLHGDESREFCQQLKSDLPDLEIIKAIPVKSPESLSLVSVYSDCVDTLLLDAYHPKMRGGTGLAIDWDILEEFQSPLPWFLAGGLTPENIELAINRTNPAGIDLSSGVESAPGRKDLNKVADLFKKVKEYLVE